VKLAYTGVKGAGAKTAKRAVTTEPGYKNGRGQVVVESTGARSVKRPGQVIYRLRCSACGLEYGANGMEVDRRCCPGCQGGEAGEVLREKQVSGLLF
jgi:hypothetical protein